MLKFAGGAEIPLLSWGGGGEARREGWKRGGAPWGGDVGGTVGGGAVSGRERAGLRLIENLNKLQREWNSVSFCLVCSCHSGRSGSAQKVGEARQGYGEGEMREGEDAEMSNLDTVNIRGDAAQGAT